jgi:transposase InsO family protein
VDALHSIYTVFVIDLASRRVQVLGSTPHPDELFMRQVSRTLSTAEDGRLRDHRVLICDRDRKWSGDVRQLLADAGIRTVCTPVRAPNANAHAERFVRSIKEECLDRIIPIGERHFRRPDGVRCPLSPRAKSSRVGQHAHRRRPGEEDRSAYSLLSSTWRAPELLRTSGVTGSADGGTVRPPLGAIGVIDQG